MNKKIKNFIDNLSKWDIIDYKGESYVIDSIDWEIYELLNKNNKWQIITYDDLFDDLLENEWK